MKVTLLIALTLMLLHPVQALPEPVLKGRLVLEGEHGEQPDPEGIPVRHARMGKTVLTDGQGRFRIELHAQYRPGATLWLQVDKPGWVIQGPLGGEIRIPSDPQETVQVKLLPEGSPRLWTNERVEALIAEILRAIKAPVTSDGGVAGIDFAGPIRDWAGRYGFDPDWVQAQLDNWASEIDHTRETPFRRGLAAIVKKELGEAERLFAESAEAGDKHLKQQAVSGSALLDATVRDFRLAGDCAFADHRFADAGDRYRAALSILDRAEQPELSAVVLHDLAAANYELGVLGGGNEAAAHLTRSADALKSVLEIQTLEETPLEWTQTQAMLLRVYEDLGDAAGMAAVVAELFSADPTNREYYKLSHALNHEVLFDFENAHSGTLSWLERFPDDMDALCNLAETRFTTGRFEPALALIGALLDSGQLPPELEAAMRMLEIANLLALSRTNEVAARLDSLRAQVEAQPDDFTVGWTFEGSSHYVGNEAALEKHRGTLFGLLWAAETGQRDALLTAIDRSHETLSLTP